MMTSTAAIRAGPAGHARVLDAVNDACPSALSWIGRRCLLRQDQGLIVLGLEQLVVADRACRRAVSPSRLPLGESTLTWPSIVRTSSRLRPVEASAAGLTWTRTADLSAPLMNDLADAFDLAEPLADDRVAVLEDLRRAAACRRSSPGS